MQVENAQKKSFRASGQAPSRLTKEEVDTATSLMRRVVVVGLGLLSRVCAASLTRDTCMSSDPAQ